MNTLFVYNTKAGNTFNTSILDEIKTHLPSKFQSDFIEIQKFDYFDTDNYECLVAVGGDGTVNTVAKRAFNQKKILAIIPQGSGDGLARFLGHTKQIPIDVNTILNGQKIQIDTADISGHFFINLAGAGFEAEVAHAFDKAGVRGILGYVKTIFRLYGEKKERKITLYLNNNRVELPFFSLSIANGNQWGNNFEIASKADIQDGRLEIAVMRKPKLHQIPNLILFMKNKRKSNPLVTYFRCDKIDVENSGDNWHIDGEPIQLKDKKTVNILPKSLTIIVSHGQKENAKA